MDATRSSKKRHLESDEDVSTLNEQGVTTATLGKRPRKTASSAPGQRVLYPVGPPTPLPGSKPVIDDPEILQKLGLTKTAAEVKAFLESIPTRRYQRLQEEQFLTPRKTWIAESEGVAATWLPFLEGRGIHDVRDGVATNIQMRVVDTEWVDVIRRDESCKLVDEHGNLFGYILRDFVAEVQILAWLQELALKQVDMAMTIRKGDVGTMVMHAYTAGERSDPSFGPARNLPGNKYTAEELSHHQHYMTSAQALFWNVAMKKIPQTVIDDFHNATENLPRADWNLQGQDTAPTPNISVKAGETDLEFSGLALGPPCGVCSSRYARYCHEERNHKDCEWVVSLTTCREAGPERGGNFFYGGFGVLVENATNTFICHKANSPHGTTIHDVSNPWSKDFTDDNLIHSGFSMLVAKTLPKAWENVLRARQGRPPLPKRSRWVPMGGGSQKGESNAEVEDVRNIQESRKDVDVEDGDQEDVGSNSQEEGC